MSVAVQTNINYYSHTTDGSKPYADVTTGQKNSVTALHVAQIENIRDTSNEYKLETSGFQLYRRAAKHKSFVDDDEIKKEYYPESIELIKELTGASRVILFDHSKHLQSPVECSVLNIERFRNEYSYSKA
jgi:hypothetical protein